MCRTLGRARKELRRRSHPTLRRAGEEERRRLADVPEELLQIVAIPLPFGPCPRVRRVGVELDGVPQIGVLRSDGGRVELTLCSGQAVVEGECRRTLESRARTAKEAERFEREVLGRRGLR